MHVMVLGAGVIGMTSAYYLSRLGYRVTVVDREDGVARGTSFANGGQLSYSFTDSLARPEFIHQIPRLLLGRDPHIRMVLSPQLISWGIRFLSQCTSKRAADNTISLLKTAMRSAILMREMRDQLPFEFSYRPAGKLVLLDTKSELANAVASTELKRTQSCETEVLNYSEAERIEPALSELNHRPIAAVYSRDDEVADARAFATGLKDWLEKTERVSFRLGTSVDRVIVRENRATAIQVDGVAHEADAVVVCLGARSRGILRDTGIDVPIYPVRGYSVTLPEGPASPSVSITLQSRRMLLSRIGNSMRIAGFADFAGFDTRDDSNRIRRLMETAQYVAPSAADYLSDGYQAWGGFRPMTPDGRPRVGPTAISGLYINVGHGMLGWTLACATGYDIAHAIANTNG